MLRLFIFAALIFFANGLFETLAAFRIQTVLSEFGLTSRLIAAYYAGFVASACLLPRLLDCYGFRRCALAAVLILSLATACLAIVEKPAVLLMIQFSCGCAISSLYILIESDFQIKSAGLEERQRWVAVYMCIWYFSIAVSQIPLFFFSRIDAMLILVASIFLISLWSVPAFPERAPHPPSQLSKLSVAQCVCLFLSALAGAFMALLLSVLPAFVAKEGGTLAQAASITLYLLIGAVIGQFVVSRCRNIAALVNVLIWMACIGLAMSISWLLSPSFDRNVCVLVIGATTFPLYAIATVSAQSLVLQQSYRVVLVAYCLLANGVGAFVAPSLIAGSESYMGSKNLFVWLCTLFVFVLSCAAFLWFNRSMQKTGVSDA